MYNLIHNNKIYTPYEFGTEKEFEGKIVNNSKAVFGEKTKNNQSTSWKIFFSEGVLWTKLNAKSV